MGWQQNTAMANGFHLPKPIQVMDVISIPAVTTFTWNKTPSPELPTAAVQEVAAKQIVASKDDLYPCNHTPSVGPFQQPKLIVVHLQVLVIAAERNLLKMLYDAAFFVIIIKSLVTAAVDLFSFLLWTFY
jgi:hypothetical protein